MEPGGTLEPADAQRGSDPEGVFVYEFTYSKTGTAIWLGHLDVMRTMERAVRRARWPVALTQGYNPRLRLRFVFPSSVGLAVLADVLFIDLTRPLSGTGDTRCDDRTIDNAPMLEALNCALPSGIAVGGGILVPQDQRKHALGAYSIADYQIVCRWPRVSGVAQPEDAVRGLLAAEQIETRKGPQRLGGFLISLTVSSRTDDTVHLDCSVRFGQNGTIKPADLVRALAAERPDIALASAVRTGLRIG